MSRRKFLHFRQIFPSSLRSVFHLICFFFRCIHGTVPPIHVLGDNSRSTPPPAVSSSPAFRVFICGWRCISVSIPAPILSLNIGPIQGSIRMEGVKSSEHCHSTFRSGSLQSCVALINRQSQKPPHRSPPQSPTTLSPLLTTERPRLRLQPIPDSSPWRLYANVYVQGRLRSLSCKGQLHLKTFNNCSRWSIPAPPGSLTLFSGSICSGAGNAITSS